MGPTIGGITIILQRILPDTGPVVDLDLFMNLGIKHPFSLSNKRLPPTSLSGLPPHFVLLLVVLAVVPQKGNGW